MPREWRSRVRDMIEAIARIQEHVEGLDEPAWSIDLRTQHAVAYGLLVLGEAANAVPEVVRATAPGIPWREVRALRNVMAHAYFQVDPAMLWRTVSDDLESLPAALTQLLQSDLPDEI